MRKAGTPVPVHKADEARFYERERRGNGRANAAETGATIRACVRACVRYSALVEQRCDGDGIPRKFERLACLPGIPRRFQPCFN